MKCKDEGWKIGHAPGISLTGVYVEAEFCSRGVWKELENWHHLICCQLMINLVCGFAIAETGLPERL